MLTLRTKKEQCSSYVLDKGAGHVEDVCGRGCGAGIDRAVRRDDRGLGAIDSPALIPAPCDLGKSGTPDWKARFRVDRLGPRHHHLRASRPLRSHCSLKLVIA